MLLHYDCDFIESYYASKHTIKKNKSQANDFYCLVATGVTQPRGFSPYILLGFVVNTYKLRL